MNSIPPVVRYCAWVSAALACAAAIAMWPPHPDAWDGFGEEVKSSYFDCTRVTPGKLLEPDLVTVCSAVAEASRERSQARTSPTPHAIGSIKVLALNEAPRCDATKEPPTCVQWKEWASCFHS